MRTVYRTWTKQRETDRYAVAGTFGDADIAKASLGVPAGTSWRQVENRLIPEYRRDRFAFVSIEREPDTPEDRIKLALELIDNYVDIEGDHHRLWLLDQVATVLGGTPRGGGIAP